VVLSLADRQAAFLTHDDAMARLNHIDFPLRGDYIPLDALLKATAIAHSGGAAKALVADGLVQVDGQQELRKTCKLRLGQVVSLAGHRIRLVADEKADPLKDTREAQSPSPEAPEPQA